MAITITPAPAEQVPGVDSTTQLNFDIPEALLAEVDFKWLMAGHGWQIDTARLNEDPVYAARLLDWAMNSDSPALRKCAAALQAHIGNAGAFSEKPGG